MDGGEDDNRILLYKCFFGTLIDFYREVLEIPVIKTDADDSNGVYFGFIENAPTLCIWDCKVFDAQPTGYQSFVFQTDNLELTMESLKKKGVAL